MCWSATASVAMVALGGVAAAVSHRRGDSPAIWLTLGYFTMMEALQAAGYAVADQCGNPANRALTLLSYGHIAAQPLVINAFAMAIAPVAVPPRMRRRVWALAALASGMMVLQALPVPALGACRPGTPLCGPVVCLVSGNWHIGWMLPLNGLFTTVADLTWMGVHFPAYMLAVFVLPLVYGAWRFVLFNFLAGPVLASSLTTDPLEMPAIWCLFSIGILLLALSPALRHSVFAAHRPA